MASWIIRSQRVVLPDGVRPASIHVDDGRIVSITHGNSDAPGTLIDAGNAVVMPGLVDSHVHINDPGRSDLEGFETATRAAAAGGVTTLVDMPLNSIPPTTTVAGLEAKRRAAAGHCHVDVGFWGGVVPGNAAELRSLGEAGVLGFKCFLVPSGVDEFPAVSESDLRAALPELAALGVPLLVHAELPGPVEAATAALGRRFIAGGQGEWSLATRSMTPASSADHNASLLARSRIGGAHLKSVAPSAISSAQSAR